MIFLFLCREVCSCCQKISSQPIDLCFLLASVHFGPREQGMFLDKGIASNYPAVPTAAMQGSPHSQSCSWGPVSESLAISPFIILTEEFNWGKTESFLEIDFALISRVINTYHLWWRTPTHHTYKMFFISTNLQHKPQPIWGGHSCQDSLLLPFSENTTKPLKVFNQRLDKSLPVTTSSAAVILINSQVTVFPLHARVSCEFNNYKSQRANHSSHRGPQSIPVVPTSLWIHQYMSTISMWQ